MNYKKYLTVLLCSLFLSTTTLAAVKDELRPKSCNKMRLMTISTKLKLTSSSKCVKYTVKNGGEFHFDVFATNTIVILVQPGGKLLSEEDVFAIINRGGEVKVVDGTVDNLHSEAGSTKVTNDAEINNQSGSALVELDNNIKLKKN
ncbi:hypothetical protein MNBD_GAMMA12-2654 [hydrothermal vent metagenome]|uniref:Uncharacterized protein n=1 Tax=hydrothermal vent metagenome TaxID=652676 RepID=A0A3B0Z409_9ZZZZ